jgi:hypothetical protein
MNPPEFKSQYHQEKKKKEKKNTYRGLPKMNKEISEIFNIYSYVFSSRTN